MWQKKLDDVLTSGLEIHDKLQKILLLGALPHSWSTFRTTQNSINCPTLIDLLANIRQEETMRSQRSSNSTTSSVAMVAYKNKRFTQRGESLKPWLKKDQNPKQGGMRFNNTYCKICKRTNHATKDCRAKTNFKNHQPWRRVQAHIVEEEMDNEKVVGGGHRNGDTT